MLQQLTSKDQPLVPDKSISHLVQSTCGLGDAVPSIVMNRQSMRTASWRQSLLQAQLWHRYTGHFDDRFWTRVQLGKTALQARH
jgi:hypothetical protein